MLNILLIVRILPLSQKLTKREREPYGLRACIGTTENSAWLSAHRQPVWQLMMLHGHDRERFDKEIDFLCSGHYGPHTQADLKAKGILTKELLAGLQDTQYII